jgi:NAD(P)-dependent dehydrogenase (short-subunit alcohol dehydrogenase family)
MVNNAGISGFDPKKPEGCRVHETQVENFDLVMEINVRGVFLGCKHALAQFLNQEPLQPNSRGDRTRGKIINMASIVGLISLDATPGYTTSKHAVIGLTKQIAGDYALDKIHCNAICPGCKRTLSPVPIQVT